MVCFVRQELRQNVIVFWGGGVSLKGISDQTIVLPLNYIQRCAGDARNHVEKSTCNYTSLTGGVHVPIDCGVCVLHVQFTQFCWQGKNSVPYTKHYLL